MTVDFKRASILVHLDELIKLQNERLRTEGWRRRPADDTRDWVAINFLFLVGREYPRLSQPARDQLDVIFREWTSAEPMTMREFTIMLEVLRELIRGEGTGYRVA